MQRICAKNFSTSGSAKYQQSYCILQLSNGIIFQGLPGSSADVRLILQISARIRRTAPHTVVYRSSMHLEYGNDQDARLIVQVIVNRICCHMHMRSAQRSEGARCLLAEPQSAGRKSKHSDFAGFIVVMVPLLCQQFCTGDRVQ